MLQDKTSGQCWWWFVVLTAYFSPGSWPVIRSGKNQHCRLPFSLNNATMTRLLSRLWIPLLFSHCLGRWPKSSKMKWMELKKKKLITRAPVLLLLLALLGEEKRRGTTDPKRRLLSKKKPSDLLPVGFQTGFKTNKNDNGPGGGKAVRRNNAGNSGKQLQRSTNKSDRVHRTFFFSEGPVKYLCNLVPRFWNWRLRWWTPVHLRLLWV